MILLGIRIILIITGIGLGYSAKVVVRLLVGWNRIRHRRRGSWFCGDTDTRTCGGGGSWGCNVAAGNNTTKSNGGTRGGRWWRRSLNGTKSSKSGNFAGRGRSRGWNRSSSLGLGMPGLGVHGLTLGETVARGAKGCNYRVVFLHSEAIRDDSVQ